MVACRGWPPSLLRCPRALIRLAQPFLSSLLLPSATPVPQLKQVLPEDIREPLVQHPQRASLLEVVLDLGRRPEARFLGAAAGQFLREGEVRAAG